MARVGKGEKRNFTANFLEYTGTTEVFCAQRAIESKPQEKKMIQKVKILGLALVAMLAMSAVAASAASATADLTAGAASGTLKATQLGTNTFTVTPGTVQCTGFSGETSYKAATITTGEGTASFSGCKAFGFLSATISMGTCKAHGEGAAEARTLIGKLVCPSGEMTVSTVGCVIHIPPQTFSGHSVAFAGGGTPADVRSVTTWEGIKYTETAGCPNVASTATTSNGTYTGELTVKAFNTAGEQVSLVAD